MIKLKKQNSQTNRNQGDDTGANHDLVVRFQSLQQHTDFGRSKGFVVVGIDCSLSLKHKKKQSENKKSTVSFPHQIKPQQPAHFQRAGSETSE
jgi:hypothetical protein